MVAVWPRHFFLKAKKKSLHPDIFFSEGFSLSDVEIDKRCFNHEMQTHKLFCDGENVYRKNPSNRIERLLEGKDYNVITGIEFDVKARHGELIHGPFVKTAPTSIKLRCQCCRKEIQLSNRYFIRYSYLFFPHQQGQD